ncbi:right-handed parallel beta-helix repeat-containing protein [Salinibacterium sp. ZJ450]|uniref:right-handed parallel beta-helix repeat-containing protein n=1 Tax=Salinibacterium sp. ZJ450 TaxID=2708338 RepID=UPI0014244AE2|nr:right-handed parallel beta-helix repeat-containing protein [Salinibacterium sp. ZJ450]
MTVNKRWRITGIAVGSAIVLAAVLILALMLINRGDERQQAGPTPTPSAPTTPTPTPPAPSGGATQAEDIECPAATVTVSTADGLHEALAAAQPGHVIALADGVYQGNFVAATSGTPDAPIWLCGSAAAILDAGGPKEDYVMHLDGAQYWRLVGFTVQNGQKGVMADGTVGSIIHGLTVTGIGDEAIHLRRFSTDSTVSGNTISNTGLRREKFGEGVYVGTAESNWCDISGCEPDRSDRNRVIGNTISGTTSEAVDIKEGTSGGTVAGNSFDGAGITAADSWIDIKGNDWLIEANTGVNSPQDGFQTHEILDGWGDRNTFRANTATVNGPGVGFALTPEKENVLECTNSATAAAEGMSNIDCVG